MEISLEEFIDLTQRLAHAAKVDQVLHILCKLEEHMSTQAIALKRLQDDMTTVQTQNNIMQQAITDANARLQAIIDKLKTSTAVDDTVDLNALAASLESVNASLVIETAAEGTVGQATKLVVSPMTANVAPGGKLSFSANIAVTWAAVSGTIDTTGVYTAPASGAASDTVTATSADNQVVSASITIG